MRVTAFRKWKKLTLAVTVFYCAGLLGCTVEGATSPRTAVTASRQYGPIPVSGRVPRPTDTDAGGVNVRAKSGLEFGGGSESKVKSVVIAYDDWNTIVGTSSVPPDVGVMLDPGYNASDIVQRRFQYLADRISLLGIAKFDELGILSSPGYGKYTLTAALYNPTNDVYELSGLSANIASAPLGVTIANHTFYSADHGGCIIPARTVYFAFLTFPRYTPMPASAKTISYSFTPVGLTPCPGQSCPGAIPISLCQE